MVVLPAPSRPRMRMRISLSPHRREKSAEKMLPGTQGAQRCARRNGVSAADAVKAAQQPAAARRSAVPIVRTLSVQRPCCRCCSRAAAFAAAASSCWGGRRPRRTRAHAPGVSRRAPTDGDERQQRWSAARFVRCDAYLASSAAASSRCRPNRRWRPPSKAASRRLPFLR